MSANENGTGRKPPPVEHQFLRRTSGNPRGRPKGAISKKRITRKIALRKLTLTIDGKPVRRTLLEWVLRTLNIENASGKPRAGALHDKYLNKTRHKEDEQTGAFLIVPERAKTVEEAIAAMEAHAAAHPYEPGSPEWHRSNEPKAPPIDPASPLGVALREFNRKWTYGAGS